MPLVRKSAVAEAIHPFDAHVRAGGRPTQEMIDFFRHRREANIAAGTAKAPPTKKVHVGLAQTPPKVKRQKPPPMFSRRQVARIGGVGAGAAALSVASHKDKSAGRPRKAAEHAAVGVGAADVGHIIAGAGIKEGIERHRNTKWTPEHEAIMARHRNRYGHKNSNGSRRIPTLEHSPQKIQNFYSHYPKSLPGGTAQRALSFHSRPRVYGTTLAVGGLAAGAAGLHRSNKPTTAPKKGVKMAVAKADLEWHTRRTSALHSLGAGAGAAIFASGASRSGMVGSTLASGSNGRRAMQITRAITRPGLEAAHSARGIGGLIHLVPTRFRPALAMGLGGSIMMREIPRIRQDSYTPAARY